MNYAIGAYREYISDKVKSFSKENPCSLNKYLLLKDKEPTKYEKIKKPIKEPTTFKDIPKK